MVPYAFGVTLPDKVAWPDRKMRIKCAIKAPGVTLDRKALVYFKPQNEDPIEWLSGLLKKYFLVPAMSGEII